MNATDIAYAAGVIDSDGTIGINKTRRKDGAVSYRPRVTVKQVTPDALDLLQSLWPALRYTAKPQAEGQRPLMVWNIHSRAAGQALQYLLPYLRIKRAHAENVLKACLLLRNVRARHEVPPIIDGEPLIPLAEAAARLGISLDSAYSAVRNNTVPVVRLPRKGRPKHSPTLMIPESFIEAWNTRGRPQRSQTDTEALEIIYLEAKRLNRVGALSPTADRPSGRHRRPRS